MGKQGLQWSGSGYGQVTLVNAVMSLRVPKNAANSLTG